MTAIKTILGCVLFLALSVSLLWNSHDCESGDPTDEMIQARAEAVIESCIAQQQVQLVTALWIVESGGKRSPPDGDGGRAIGPFQIHRAYWEDAASVDAVVAAGRWEDCRDFDYAARVVQVYLQRWAPWAWSTGDVVTLARIHKGGPCGACLGETLEYAQRVLEIARTVR